MTTDLQTQADGYSAYSEGTTLNEEPRGGFFGLPVLKFNGQTGAFFDVEGDTEYKTGVQVIPLLRIGSTRVKFPAGDAGEDASGPECASDDNLYPRDPEQAAQIGAGPACQSCVFGQWEEGEDGRRLAPACREIVNYAVVLAEDPQATVMLLPAKGNSIKPLREAIQRVGALAKRAQRPPFAYLLSLSATAQKRGSQRFYQLAADVAGDPVPVERMPELRAAYEEALQFVIPDRAAIARQMRVQVAAPGRPAIVEAQARALPAAPGAGPQVELPLDDLSFDAEGNAIRRGPDGAILPLITPAQHETLLNIAAERLGFDADRVGGLTQERFGYMLSDITVAEANELLAWIQTQKSQKPRRG